MPGESSAESSDPALQAEDFDREALRATFMQLQLACAGAGLDAENLLARPAHEVGEFAQIHSINIRDLRDICELMLRRLDSLDSEFAALEKLMSH